MHFIRVVICIVPLEFNLSSINWAAEQRTWAFATLLFLFTTALHEHWGAILTVASHSCHYQQKTAKATEVNPPTHCSLPLHVLSLLPLLHYLSPHLHALTHSLSHSPQLLFGLFSLAVSVSLSSRSFNPLSLPPVPNLLQGLSAGQQGLLQLTDAALQLVNLFVALSQLTTQLLWAEQQLTAPIRLLLQLGGQLVHLVVRGREREKWWEREWGEGGGFV